MMTFKYESSFIINYLVAGYQADWVKLLRLMPNIRTLHIIRGHSITPKLFVKTPHPPRQVFIILCDHKPAHAHHAKMTKTMVLSPNSTIPYRSLIAHTYTAQVDASMSW